MTMVVSEIDHVCSSFAKAWNEHDMRALAGLFAEDAEFVNVVGIWWHGREQIREAHEATHATLFKDSRLRMPETAVRYLRPGMAVARSRWRLEGHVSPEGDPLPAREGLPVFTLLEQGGRWEVVDAQNTDIVEGVPFRPQ